MLLHLLLSTMFSMLCGSSSRPYKRRRYGDTSVMRLLLRFMTSSQLTVIGEFTPVTRTSIGSARPFNCSVRASSPEVSIPECAQAVSLIRISPAAATDDKRAVVLAVSPSTVISCIPELVPTTPMKVFPVCTPTPNGNHAPLELP